MTADIHLTYWVTHALEEEAPTGTLDALSPDELARCAGLWFGRDRRDFAAAHALLRAALSSTADRPNEKWTFEAGPHGKPHLAPATAAHTPLSFNLAHTRGLVACAVVHDADVDVGVDVEAIDRHVDLGGLARRFFAPTEAAEVLRLEGEERERRFFETWTLKEAYIKAHGKGLSHPLDTFSFCVEDGALRFDSADEDDADTWRFALLDVAGRYRTSLAFRDRSRLPRRVVLHEATSIDTRVVASASLLRVSPLLVVERASARTN